MWTRRREEKDDAYYDELIKQRIGEAIRSHMDDEKLDRAVLDAWIEEDNRKRAARRKRYMAVAACVLVLCIGTFGIKMILETEDTVAVAGKGDDVVNESGNNVVIKNNREDVEENIGVRTVTCTTWDAVEEAKETYPELITPGYVPTKYAFDLLKIQKNSIIENFTYTYSANDKTLEIKQIVGGEQTLIYDYDRKISCDKYELIITEEVGKAGYCIMDDSIIAIIGDITDEEMVAIIDNIQ